MRTILLVGALSTALVTAAVVSTGAVPGSPQPLGTGFTAPTGATAAPAARAAPARTRPRNVAIVLYDMVELLDFAGPAEVLQAAGSFAARDGASALNLYLVARTTAPITAQGFVQVVPQYSIDNAPPPDLVVIPGGNSQTLVDDPAMMAWLATVTTGAEVTLTVCTGAFPLAKLGALDGLDVTTFYRAVPRLAEVAPRAHVIPGRRFIDNGRIITTAGVSAGIDGALHLVARLFGRRIADQTARYMEYRWTPEPYLAADYPYFAPDADARGHAWELAQLATDDKRWPEAIAAYRALAPGDASGATWRTLGDLLFQTGDLAAAEAAYRRVAPGAPAYGVAQYNLACTLARAGKPDAAVAAITKALAAGIKRDQALADSDLASIRDRIAALP